MITLPPPFPYEMAGLVVPKVEMVELVPVDLVELLLLELLLLLPVLPLLLLPLLPVEPFPPPLRRWSAGDTTGTNMSRMGSENLGWTMSFIGLVLWCVLCTGIPGRSIMALKDKKKEEAGHRRPKRKSHGNNCRKTPNRCGHPWAMYKLIQY